MANSEQLSSAEVSHQIYLQRLAAGTASKLNPVLEDFGRWVRKQILSEGETIQTKKALNALLKDVNERMTGDLDGWVALLESDLNKLAGYETQFQANLIDSAITNDDFSPAIPATNQVISAAKNNPLVLGGSNSAVSYQAYINSYTKEQVAQAASIISGGFTQGQTTAQISSNLLNNGLAKSSRDGFTLAKTTTNHMAAQAKDKTYRENSDVVIGYVIVATLDSKTSDICRFHDGQEVKWSDSYQPMPPFHYNCVLDGTVVTTCSDVRKLYKRAYKGTIVDIVTKSGRKLSITPNHPILTKSGWKAAKLVNATDKLGTVKDGVFVSDNYKNSVKAEVSDLFSAVNISIKPSFVANRPTTAKDFHGDISNGEVSIIDVNSLIWERVKSILNKDVVNNGFNIRSFINNTLDRLSSFCKGLPTTLASPQCFVGGLSILTSNLKRGSIHSSLLLRRLISNLSKFRHYKSADWSVRATQAEMLSDPTNTDAGFVSFDDVESVSFREIDGCWHVYNLENEDNWYLSNGIITHNCRTTTAPLINGKYSFDDSAATRASVGDTGGKQVSAKETYYTWLKKQDKAFVDEALGVERSAVFRNAGLTPNEFRKASNTRLGKPLTLDEMASKDQKIADYLKK